MKTLDSIQIKIPFVQNWTRRIKVLSEMGNAVYSIKADNKISL